MIEMRRKIENGRQNEEDRKIFLVSFRLKGEIASFYSKTYSRIMRCLTAFDITNIINFVLYIKIH